MGVGAGGCWHSDPQRCRGCRVSTFLPPQLVHMFSSLLERPLLRAAVSPQCSVLLATFGAELDDVKRLFDTWTRTGAAVPLHANMPPVAGQLQWALELQQRLQGTHRELFAINHPYVRLSPGTAGTWGRCDPAMAAVSAVPLPDSVMTSPEATLVSGKYEEMMGLLRGYCEQVYAVWASGADQDCLFHLEQPLIHRDPNSSLISVNFSREVMPAVMHLDADWSYVPPNMLHFPNKHCPHHGVFLQLTAVLREVKYLGFQKQKDIPEGAERLFAQKQTLQTFVDNLDLMTGWYNKASSWCWCWSVPRVLPC